MPCYPMKKNLPAVNTPSIKVINSYYYSFSSAPLRTPVTQRSRTCPQLLHTAPEMRPARMADTTYSALQKAHQPLRHFTWHAGAPGLSPWLGACGPVPETLRALPRWRRASQTWEDPNTHGSPDEWGDRAWAAEEKMGTPEQQYKI